MKNTEFRIGNLLYDANDKLCKVELLSNEEDCKVYAPVIHGALTTLPNKPIILTKLLIPKLGFKKNVGNFYTINESKRRTGFIVKFWNNDKIDVVYNSHRLFSIKYVHELQNIYYYLEKIELHYNNLPI